MRGSKPRLDSTRAMINPNFKPKGRKPVSPAGVAKCPRHLNDEARQYFKSIVDILKPMGLASVADVHLLSILSAALARWQKAQSECARLGGEVVAHKGRPLLNPWLSVSAHAEATIMRVCAEVGLSPTSRTRLFAIPTTPPLSAGAQQQESSAESYFSDGIDDGAVQ